MGFLLKKLFRRGDRRGKDSGKDSPEPEGRSILQVFQEQNLSTTGEVGEKGGDGKKESAPAAPPSSSITKGYLWEKLPRELRVETPVGYGEKVDPHSRSGRDLLAEVAERGKVRISRISELFPSLFRKPVSPGMDKEIALGQPQAGDPKETEGGEEPGDWENFSFTPDSAPAKPAEKKPSAGADDVFSSGESEKSAWMSEILEDRGTPSEAFPMEKEQSPFVAVRGEGDLKPRTPPPRASRFSRKRPLRKRREAEPPRPSSPSRGSPDWMVGLRERTGNPGRPPSLHWRRRERKTRRAIPSSLPAFLRRRRSGKARFSLPDGKGRKRSPPFRSRKSKACFPELSGRRGVWKAAGRLRHSTFPWGKRPEKGSSRGSRFPSETSSDRLARRSWALIRKAKFRRANRFGCPCPSSSLNWRMAGC